jgi:hypothetical protein
LVCLNEALGEKLFVCRSDGGPRRPKLRRKRTRRRNFGAGLVNAILDLSLQGLIDFSGAMGTPMLSPVAQLAHHILSELALPEVQNGR